MMKPFAYLRGKRILFAYTRHHRKAQRIFRNEHHGPSAVGRSLRDVGVRVIAAGGTRNFIDLPPPYLELVERVADGVNARFADSKNCRFFPALAPGPLPERTEEIEGVRNREVISIQLVDPFVIDGLYNLCEPILRELESRLYGSYVLADRLYVYRSPISRQAPKTSWLWHYDNHPHEVIKIMIYLTDVTPESAPFEYLRHYKSAKPLLGSPLAPDYGNARIADTDLSRYMAQGYEICRITGLRGTLIIFDNNVIHRATLARQTHRDVLVLQVRPLALRSMRSVDPRWTGAFQHTAFNRNPNDVELHVKSDFLPRA